MNTYNDDALCLCPELVEKMSKEYFSALHDCGIKIVSLSNHNSNFFERHVKELALLYSKLSQFCTQKSFTKQTPQNNQFDHLSKKVLNMFGLEAHYESIRAQTTPKEQSLLLIYSKIFALNMLMLKNFENHSFYTDCMQYCNQSAEALSCLASNLTKN